ncbi:MAG: hypothetical protein COU69_01745 [Candidatus Pacebacteria bacterium CG10_big_fil_rev_8_21_14_0_10_56_10]|nr:MAG: hypothetical protein COU69_01745 [Candidatus Pacebacteria bacterium CG10_big_fil_rev_8_21_14_0_10_56_10]
MTQHLHFQITRLQRTNVQRLLEGVLVVVVALIVAAILPGLLIRYVYAGQQLLEQPQVLELVPTLSFLVAVVYAGYVFVGNFLRSARINTLERRLEAGQLGDDTVDKQLVSAARQAVAAQSSDQAQRSSAPKKRRGRPKKK